MMNKNKELTDFDKSVSSFSSVFLCSFFIGFHKGVGFFDGYDFKYKHYEIVDIPNDVEGIFAVAAKDYNHGNSAD